MAYPSRKTTHHIHNGWLFWHRHLAWTSALAYPTSFPCSNTPEGQGSQGWIAGAWPQILRSGKNDAKKTTPNPGNKAKDASKRVQLNHWQVIWFAKASQGRLPGYLAGPLFFQQSGPFVAVQIRFLERKHVRDHKKNNTQKKSDNINKG